jgi:hypothetical protein
MAPDEPLEYELGDTPIVRLYRGTMRTGSPARDGVAGT